MATMWISTCSVLAPQVQAHCEHGRTAGVLLGARGPEQVAARALELRAVAAATRLECTWPGTQLQSVVTV